MKKIILLIAITGMLAFPVFASKPGRKDVEKNLEGVFQVYAVVFMAALFGTEIEGADLKMDMNTQSSTLTMDKLNVIEMLQDFQSAMEDQDIDISDFPFKKISGTIATDSDSNMEMDVTLSGGSIKHLQMGVAGEDISYLTADGYKFDHLDEIDIDSEEGEFEID